MVSSDTPPATPTGSQSTQAYQPPKPLFGDLTQVSDTSFEPWIGGIPKVDYSDLKTKPALIEPTMYRSTYIPLTLPAPTKIMTAMTTQTQMTKIKTI
jgi:hypothetical protein